MICVGTERRFLYYVSIGFKSCKKYNICTEDGRYPAAMMVKELIPHTLDDGREKILSKPGRVLYYEPFFSGLIGNEEKNGSVVCYVKAFFASHICVTSK